MARPLHLTMERTNPLTMLEWLWVSSLSLGGNLDLENTKLLPEVFELHPSQWLRQYISYLLYLISICLDLSWNTGFSDNFMELWLSQYIQVAPNWRSNKSDSSFLSHTSSQLAEQAVTYSASAILSATDSY